MGKITSGNFTLTAVKNGDDAVTYEIVPTNAYYMLDTNNNTVVGRVQGYLYKIIGGERVPLAGKTIQLGYKDRIDSQVFPTDSDGFFDTDVWVDGSWEDDYFNAESIYVRYVIDNQVVAQHNVGLSKSGIQGKRGAPLRVSEWSTGWTYYAGTGDNDPYTDVVRYNGKYYLCVKSHANSTAPTEGGNNSYWHLSDNFEMIATKVLLAENAYINLLQGNKIQVEDTLNNVVAGLAGVNDYPFWVGTNFENRATAPIRFSIDGSGHLASGNIKWDKEGKACLTGVEVEGTIRAKNLYKSVYVTPVKSDSSLGSLDGKSRDKHDIYLSGLDKLDVIVNGFTFNGELKHFWSTDTEGKNKYIFQEKTNIENINDVFPLGVPMLWVETEENTDIYKKIPPVENDKSNYSLSSLGFVQHTGYADVLMFVQYASLPSLTADPIYYLPPPQCYPGKIIDIYNRLQASSQYIYISSSEGQIANKIAVLDDGTFDQGSNNTTTYKLNEQCRLQVYSTGTFWCILDET